MSILPRQSGESMYFYSFKRVDKSLNPGAVHAYMHVFVSYYYTSSVRKENKQQNSKQSKHSKAAKQAGKEEIYYM